MENEAAAMEAKRDILMLPGDLGAPPEKGTLRADPAGHMEGGSSTDKNNSRVESLQFSRTRLQTTSCITHISKCESISSCLRI
jgi:hypothetical protein